ncbi:MAG: hypothetical protein ACYTGN_17785 [Planctomycetota bacterium]
MRVMAWILAAGALSVACTRKTTTSFVYPDDLTHPAYVKRTKAVREFAVRKDASQLPDAFGLLLDREAHIRSMAYEAIKDMSPDGRDFGYRPYLSEGVRAGIVERWEAWWVAQAAEESADG